MFWQCRVSLIVLWRDHGACANNPLFSTLLASYVPLIYYLHSSCNNISLFRQLPCKPTKGLKVFTLLKNLHLFLLKIRFVSYDALIFCFLCKRHELTGTIIQVLKKLMKYHTVLGPVCLFVCVFLFDLFFLVLLACLFCSLCVYSQEIVFLS